MGLAVECSEYGPIDVFVVEFEGAGLDAGVLDPVLCATASGAVRPLDLAAAVRAADGTVSYLEVAGTEDGFAADGVMLEVQGLLGEEDRFEAVASIAPGFGVAPVALEMLWGPSSSPSVSRPRAAPSFVPNESPHWPSSSSSLSKPLSKPRKGRTPMPLLR